MSTPNPKPYMSNDHAQTSVEDMLIKSIEPQIQEIQDKIGRQEPLSKDDIYTLLLKSQYNHINHLDQKLNYMSDEVSGLKHEFQDLKHEFKLLEQRVDHKIDALDQKLDHKIDALDQKIQTTIQKALNRNMLALIGVMGFFLTLSKLIDKF